MTDYRDPLTGDPLTEIKTTFKEKPTPRIIYVGEALQPDAREKGDKPIWRLKRIFADGDLEVTTYAGNGRYDQVWDNRADIFGDSLVVFNDTSVNFNGINQYLNAGDNYQYDIANQWSLSFWTKLDNTSAQRAFFAKTGGASVYGIGLYHNSSGKLFLQVRTPSVLRSHVFSSTLSTGSWLHIVLTYKGSSNMSGFTAYINGLTEGSPSSASLSGSLLGGYDALFGSREGSFCLSGLMDQISIWSKALSSGEVNTLYNSGVPIDASNVSFSEDLAHYYPVGEGGDAYPLILDNKGSANLQMINMAGTNFSSDVPG